MNLRQYLDYPNRRLAAEAVMGAAIAKGGERVLRKRLAPSLAELAAVTDGIRADPSRLLAAADWSSEIFSGDTPDELAREHEKIKGELEERYRSQRMLFPHSWAVEAGTSFLLYALVRGFKPQVVIEMGVANGQSSYYILSALRANGSGRLHSLDINPDVGGLLSDEERALWDLRIVRERRGPQSLVDHLADLPPADLCFHDADHGYLAQFFEFGRLWDQLTDAGILVIDDVDESYGLIDFCASIDKRPEILIDGRKAIGILPRSAPQLPAARRTGLAAA